LVIPNGFEIDPNRSPADSSLKAELGLPVEARIVANVGRFHRQKDHGTFFRATAIVGRDYPDVHFVLCGAGVSWDNPELVRMVEESGLRGRVHLLGVRRDIADILRASLLVASSSCGEAFPMVIGEAMSCGRPCVVTDVGDCAEIVGKAGSVVPPREPATLAAAIIKMLTFSEQEIQTLGNAARQRIHDNFELDAVVGKYESLYRTVVQEHRPVAQPKADICSTT
jgi:glycosyltransferase involved in cell wall biosynthesis